jgi:hypothetical protein
LWGHADDSGERVAHAPLAQEIWRQSPRLLEARAALFAASERAAAL